MIKRDWLPHLRETARALAERDNPNVIMIEDASTGSALDEDLQQAHGLPVKLVPVELGKEARRSPSQVRGRLVHVPKAAPFLADLLAESLTFPVGKTDDQ